MENYLDSSGNQLRKGFYTSGGRDIYFFTGKYTSEKPEGIPLFRHEGEITLMFTSERISELYPLDKIDVNNIISVTREQINWLEKELDESGLFEE